MCSLYVETSESTEKRCRSSLSHFTFLFLAERSNCVHERVVSSGARRIITGCERCPRTFNNWVPDNRASFCRHRRKSRRERSEGKPHQHRRFYTAVEIGSGSRGRTDPVRLGQCACAFPTPCARASSRRQTHKSSRR